MWLLEIDQATRRGNLTIWCVGDLDARVHDETLEVRINEQTVASLHVGNVGVHHEFRQYDDHTVLTFSFTPASLFAEGCDSQSEDVYDMYCRECNTRVINAEDKDGYLMPSSAWEAFSDAFACEECTPWTSCGEQLFKAKKGRVYWTPTQAVIHPSDAEVHGDRCRVCNTRLGVLSEDGQSIALDKSNIAMYGLDCGETNLLAHFSHPAHVALSLLDQLALSSNRHFNLVGEQGEVEIRLVHKDLYLHSAEKKERAMRVWYRYPAVNQGRSIACGERIGACIEQLEISAANDFPPSVQKLPSSWKQAYLPLPLVY